MQELYRKKKIYVILHESEILKKGSHIFHLKGYSRVVGPYFKKLSQIIRGNFYLYVLIRKMAPFLCRYFLLEDGFNVLSIIKFSKSTGVIIDVGSNDGTSIAMIRQYFKQEIIWAFDPVVKYNKINKNIVFKNLACGNVESTLFIYVPWVGRYRFSQYSSTSTDYIDAQLRKDLKIKNRQVTFEKVATYVVQIDSFDLNPIFIKIDVEGYELIVLQGAKRTITKYKPVVLVEINDLSKFDNIYHFLKDLGYICVETWGRKKIKYKEISQFTKNINNYSFISPSLLQFGSADDKE